MKNQTIIAMITLLLMAVGAKAQPDGPREKVEAIRVGVYTRVLNLTADEAQKFWPLFNKYQEELRALHKGMREERPDSIEEFNNMSDAEVGKLIDTYLEMEQKELDLKKKYTAEFKKILPVKKVAMLPRAEREFKRELLEKIRDRRRGGG